MFVVDEATVAAIRLALERDGELSAVAELRRRFPLITDNEDARRCVRAIASWKPLPPAKPIPMRRQLRRREMADQVVSYSMASTLHQEAKDRGTSPTWVVTKGSGCSGKLVARLVVEQPTSYVLTGNTLAEVYAKLPWGLTHSERRLADPPEVIEVWCDEDDGPG